MRRMDRLVEALGRHQVVGLATPIFIYHIEQSQPWAHVASRALHGMADGRYAGVTPVLTLMELAVKPLQLGRPGRRMPTRLRAEHGLRTPDALQIAACVTAGATAMLSNDRRWGRVREIEMLTLDNFL
jgi:hypothetical protein